MDIDCIREQLLFEREDAEQDLAETRKIAPNSYGQGYEAGRIAVLDWVLAALDQ